MSDEAIPYADPPLRGEKVSIGSPAPADLSMGATAAAGHEFIRMAVAVVARAAPALWPAVSLCGAVALWSAPALLLSRYAPDDLFDALVRVSLRPTGGELLTLFLVLMYIILTGLMIGGTMALPRRKAVRVLIRLAAAPMVILSMLATFFTAVPLFFGALIFCFPGLV
jgi:hypothetical protein